MTRIQAIANANAALSAVQVILDAALSMPLDKWRSPALPALGEFVDSEGSVVSDFSVEISRVIDPNSPSPVTLAQGYSMLDTIAEMAFDPNATAATLVQGPPDNSGRHFLTPPSESLPYSLMLTVRHFDSIGSIDRQYQVTIDWSEP